jgi:hypothetical protein
MGRGDGEVDDQIAAPIPIPVPMAAATTRAAATGRRERRPGDDAAANDGSGSVAPHADALPDGRSSGETHSPKSLGDVESVADDGSSRHGSPLSGTGDGLVGVLESGGVTGPVSLLGSISSFISLLTRQQLGTEDITLTDECVGSVCLR